MHGNTKTVYSETGMMRGREEKEETTKREIATRLVDAALHGGAAAVSFQVVQATLNVITRKLAVPVEGLIIENPFEG